MLAKQLILFGSPGVGKSYLIEHSLLPDLGIAPNSDNSIKTVFHPEYTYGDFMGKLLPMSREGKVEYTFYAGHFLTSLARAYRCILDNPESPANVALTIDELNRGNSAAIFGPAFQLLDRDSDGWSSYHIDVSDMEFETLVREIGVTVFYEQGRKDRPIYKFAQKDYRDTDDLLKPVKVRGRAVRIPPNLSLFATINTSDASIYYMDTAFKRRWDWEFVGPDSERYSAPDVIFAQRAQWNSFVRRLNAFIRENSSSVRNIEDKQIGSWFIKEEPITLAQVQNKLLFFLWDSVFARDRKPLQQLLKLEPKQLVTFGDFCSRGKEFVAAIEGLPAL